MKNLSRFIRIVFGLICITLINFLTTYSQTTPTPENERKVRYITSNKSKELPNPEIRIVKRTSISRIPAAAERPLRADDQGLEKLAFNLINDKRSEKGLKPLIWNDQLADLARNHSENMAKYSFFNHIGLNGRLIDQRAIDLGINKWKAIGENIAYNKGFEKPADFAVERWMISDSHRKNLLDGRWVESGIGVGITDEGSYFFTQIFLVN